MQETSNQPGSPGVLNSLNSIVSIFDSTLGRKIIMGLSGLGLVLFVTAHLAGNLTLFVSKDAFNGYAHKLESLGPILNVLEFGLLAAFIFHISYALSVTAQNKKARQSRYQASGDAGKPSRKSLSSKSMIYTGVILGLFVILHVVMFKYGPGIKQGYIAELHGDQVRDLYRLVVESFKNPLIVAGYVAVQVLLGIHLRHGFWSAFQSLGAYHPRYTPVIYTVGVLLAIVLALGFLALPIYAFIAIKPV